MHRIHKWTYELWYPAIVGSYLFAVFSKQILPDLMGWSLISVLYFTFQHIEKPDLEDPSESRIVRSIIGGVIELILMTVALLAAMGNFSSDYFFLSTFLAFLTPPVLRGAFREVHFAFDWVLTGLSIIAALMTAFAYLCGPDSLAGWLAIGIVALVLTFYLSVLCIFNDLLPDNPLKRPTQKQRAAVDAAGTTLTQKFQWRPFLWPGAAWLGLFAMLMAFCIFGRALAKDVSDPGPESGHSCEGLCPKEQAPGLSITIYFANGTDEAVSFEFAGEPSGHFQRQDSREVWATVGSELRHFIARGRCPDARILVAGHADSRGERLGNYDRAWDRARTTVERLSNLLVLDAPERDNKSAPPRLDIRVRGEDQPSMNISGPNAVRSDRRVEIVVYCSSSQTAPLPRKP